MRLRLNSSALTQPAYVSALLSERRYTLNSVVIRRTFEESERQQSVDGDNARYVVFS